MASKNYELLSLKDLTALWTEMAESFGTELEVPINNGASLVMKFQFSHELGKTEIKIVDLASHGSSLSGQGSTINTTIETRLTNSFSQEIKISLPPIFPSLIRHFRKNVTTIRLGKDKYWFHYKPLKRARELSKSETFQSLNNYNGLYCKGKSSLFSTRTTTYLGRKEQIQEFLQFHYDLLKALHP